MKEVMASYGMNTEDEESRDTIIPDSLPANVFQEDSNGHSVNRMDMYVHRHESENVNISGSGRGGRAP